MSTTGVWVSLFVLGVVPLGYPSEPAAPQPPESPVVIPAGPGPIPGERLAFHGRWLGIPVGYGWIEVKGIVEVEGRQAIQIEAHGYTNQILSQFYPIHDTLRSYLDAETLEPLRFEKDQREGHYRAHEVVTFDRQRRIATYRSLLNQSVKEIRLPDEFQDLLSAFYWFRTQSIRPGQPMSLEVYTDEKMYDTTLDISQPFLLELLKRGSFLCVTVEPKASFQGLLVRRGRLWAYMTADAYRLPLLVKATTPWGPMSAVLEESSITKPVRPPHHAGGDSAGP